MKPCRKYQKQIAWLAAAALDDGEARALRAHLETCPGCRAYLAEVSDVTGHLATAQANRGIQASEHFHGKLIGRFRTAAPESTGEFLAAYFRTTFLNWRVALPLVAVLALLAVTVATWRQPVKVAALPRVVAPVARPSGADSDLAPTIANYERAASQSLDKLDELLTRQALRNLPPAPPLNASALSGANLPE